MFNRLRETGVCIENSEERRRIWETWLRQDGPVWTVTILQCLTGRRIDKTYGSEQKARHDLHFAYALGAQHGKWRIERAYGYKPCEPHLLPA